MERWYLDGVGVRQLRARGNQYRASRCVIADGCQRVDGISVVGVVKEGCRHSGLMRNGEFESGNDWFESDAGDEGSCNLISFPSTLFLSFYT